MNPISKILLGFIIIAVIACVWYLLTRKNEGGGGCCGDCSRCGCGCDEKRGEKNGK